MRGLQDRVAIVTGAANGIGAAITRRLHQEGAKVALLDVDQTGGKVLADQLGAERALFIACDVTRAREELGYEPEVTLHEGMRASIRWCLERGEPV